MKFLFCMRLRCIVSVFMILALLTGCGNDSPLGDNDGVKDEVPDKNTPEEEGGEDVSQGGDESESDQWKDDGRDIYVIGTGLELFENDWNTGLVEIWKNGEVVKNYNLDTPSKIEFSHLESYISGEDIYFLGTYGYLYYLGNHKEERADVKVWKNGKVLYELVSGMSLEDAEIINITDLAVSETGDVYVIGTIKTRSEDFKEIYTELAVWKNGVKTYTLMEVSETISDESSFDCELFALGEDIYTAFVRNQNNVHYSYVYKNGDLLYDLGNRQMSRVNTIYVDSNQDVYVGGMKDGYNLGVWRNGLLWKQMKVSDSTARIQSIMNINGDVYILYGITGGSTFHALIKNDKAVFSLQDCNDAISFFVLKDDIYLVGNASEVKGDKIYSAIRVWKNGKKLFDFQPEFYGKQYYIYVKEQ